MKLKRNRLSSAFVETEDPAFEPTKMLSRKERRRFERMAPAAKAAATKTIQANVGKRNIGGEPLVSLYRRSVKEAIKRRARKEKPES